MSEEKRAAVKKFLAEVQTPPSGRGPEFDRKLSEISYTMNELGLWPDDAHLSAETIKAAWQVFARLLRQPGALPENLKM